MVGIPRLSVVNVVGSAIARETKMGVYLNAGRETAVASTKAFTTQARDQQLHEEPSNHGLWKTFVSMGHTLGWSKFASDRGQTVPGRGNCHGWVKHGATPF